MSASIFSLPNEVGAFHLPLFRSLLTRRNLLSIATTCRQLLSLILRTVVNRLQRASNLPDHVLYLECFDPSTVRSGSRMFCVPLQTNGLNEVVKGTQDTSTHIHQPRKIRDLYTRFYPQARDSKHPFQRASRHPAGDVEGSRTHPSANTTENTKRDYEGLVAQTVTIDAQDLFSQLAMVANIVYPHRSEGLLLSHQEICDGTIRVWRDWLARECELKTWTDGEPVYVHRNSEDDLSHASSRTKDNQQVLASNGHESSILWTNDGNKRLGVKFRVKRRKWRMNTVIPFQSELDVSVSYEVVFEEIWVRTTHLLLQLEEAQMQMQNRTGTAIMFSSSFDTGLREVDTGGARIIY